MRYTLLLLGCVVLAPAGALAQVPGIRVPPDMRYGACVVVRVIDGDTIDCASGERLRLLLIDAPEMEQTPHGEQARAALLALAPVGTTTNIELDVQEQDRYGRILGYLYLSDGRMVNEELARLGYAVASAYPPNVKHLDRIRSAVTAARQSERGLWATTAFRCRHSTGPEDADLGYDHWRRTLLTA